MKALILHGTDATPQANWFPWLKQKLQEQGYEVWVPLLPCNHTPNRKVYNDFIFSSGWELRDNVVIGHSAGAVSVLNLLMDNRCPPIQLGVMAGAWVQGAPKEFDEPGQFDYMFPPEGFDFETIKAKADKLVFVHGDDDPYCPLEQAQWLAGQLDADIHLIKGGQHLGSKYKEIPELLSIVNNATA